jgi:hypothetical protein
MPPLAAAVCLHWLMAGMSCRLKLSPGWHRRHGVNNRQTYVAQQPAQRSVAQLTSVVTAYIQGMLQSVVLLALHEALLPRRHTLGVLD